MHFGATWRQARLVSQSNDRRVSASASPSRDQGASCAANYPAAYGKDTGAGNLTRCGLVAQTATGGLSLRTRGDGDGRRSGWRAHSKGPLTPQWQRDCVPLKPGGAGDGARASVGVAGPSHGSQTRGYFRQAPPRAPCPSTENHILTISLPVVQERIRPLARGRFQGCGAASRRLRQVAAASITPTRATARNPRACAASVA